MFVVFTKLSIVQKLRSKSFQIPILFLPLDRQSKKSECLKNLIEDFVFILEFCNAIQMNSIRL